MEFKRIITKENTIYIDVKATADRLGNLLEDAFIVDHTWDEWEIVDTNQILLAVAHHWIDTLEH